ncbi:MAG: esterase family protein, partial [Planctomycetia bacterium]|nr:esterase family protein [Planctomycetia bacterium]
MALAPTAGAQPTFPKPSRYEPTADERAQIGDRAAALVRAIAAVPEGTVRDALADVVVYNKAAAYALRFNDFYDPKDVATTLTVLDRGLERARQLADGRRPWADARGYVARGYVSRVDGSVQPFAVVVPEGLELGREKRARLDVVLHGRTATPSEVRFLAANDARPAPADAAGKLTLHVFGRTNNAYRWAGEADVFEAIEAVKKAYPVDDLRVVLRGFSMGGAGAWHLGLHHPALWSSVEAGAGFTETRQYAKLGDVPPYIEKGLHIYDSVDYALNAFDVPVVGYGGEDDPQLQASAHIVEALKALGFRLKTDGLVTRGEGFDFLRVVGARTGHKVDPDSARILSAFHDEHARKGADLRPPRIRFATYTAKYGRAAWLGVERLKEHYRRAEVDAEVKGDRVVVHKAENVAVLAVDRHAAHKIAFGGQEFDLEGAVKGLLPNVYFRADGAGDGWRQLDYKESRAVEENADRGKRRGLQGPIDDAFTGPFLCVRGTGDPWSPTVERWSTARLDQFARDWAVFLRGDVRIKNDTQVTDEDVENYHLILFGDPGSNRLIARVLNGLPFTWTRTELTLGGQTYAPGTHAPV